MLNSSISRSEIEEATIALRKQLEIELETIVTLDILKKSAENKPDFGIVLGTNSIYPIAYKDIKIFKFHFVFDENKDLFNILKDQGYLLTKFFCPEFSDRFHQEYANFFALSFLMPKEQFKKVLKANNFNRFDCCKPELDLSSNSNFKASLNSLKNYYDENRKLFNSIVTEIAKYFDLSNEYVIDRARGLNLF